MMNTKKVRLDLSEEDPVGLRQWTPLNQHGASPFHYFGSQTGRLFKADFQYYPKRFRGHCNLSCQPLQLSIFCRRHAASSEHSRSIIVSRNLQTIVMLEWILAVGLIVALVFAIKHFRKVSKTDTSMKDEDIAGTGFENWVGPKSFDPRNPASLVNNNPDDNNAQ